MKRNHLEVAVVLDRCCCVILENLKFPVGSPAFSVAPGAAQAAAGELQCWMKEEERILFRVRSSTTEQHIDTQSFKCPIDRVHFFFFFGLCSICIPFLYLENLHYMVLGWQSSSSTVDSE